MKKAPPSTNVKKDCGIYCFCYWLTVSYFKIFSKSENLKVILKDYLISAKS